MDNTSLYQLQYAGCLVHKAWQLWSKTPSLHLTHAQLHFGTHRIGFPFPYR